jgi:hypothetical protein
MIDFLKSHRARLLRDLLLIVSIFLFTSCSSVVCLTGFCSSEEEYISKITWIPPLLNHQNCPCIDGRYEAKYLESNNSSLMNEFPQISDQYGFYQVSLETIRKIPEQRIPWPINNSYTTVWSNSGFYKNAFVLINQNEHELVISLMDGVGKLYRRQTINLDSSMIGCDGEDLIIRTISTSGSAEGTSRGANAEEMRYKKLGDGRLRITTNIRYWIYDNFLGLIGLNSNGSANSTGLPREIRYTHIFPSIQ